MVETMRWPRHRLACCRACRQDAVSRATSRLMVLFDATPGLELVGGDVGDRHRLDFLHVERPPNGRARQDSGRSQVYSETLLFIRAPM